MKPFDLEFGPFWCWNYVLVVSGRLHFGASLQTFVFSCFDHTKTLLFFLLI
jgi:hypothetical protein